MSATPCVGTNLGTYVGWLQCLSWLSQICLVMSQVRDLMVYLEAQQHIQAGGEMAQGTVLPVPEPASAPKRKGSKGRGRQ